MIRSRYARRRYRGPTAPPPPLATSTRTGRPTSTVLESQNLAYVAALARQREEERAELEREQSTERAQELTGLVSDGGAES